MEELINHINSALYLAEAIGCFWLAIQGIKAIAWILTNLEIIPKEKKKDE